MGSQSDIETMITEDPDSFFAPPYASPYEAMCLEDSAAAEDLDPNFESAADSVAERAYKTAWKWCPHEEFCALFSDDVRSLYSLLVITNGNVRPFSAERIRWYCVGRVPWGYVGNYPNGEWVVL